MLSNNQFNLFLDKILSAFTFHNFTDFARVGEYLVGVRIDRNRQGNRSVLTRKDRRNRQILSA
jgi:hypothetical protein